MDNDTIAAIATPMGTSGIGIIRLSGTEAVSIVEPIFKASGKSIATSESSAFRNQASHFLRYGHIVHPHNNQIVDEVMTVVMRSPHSYTREDVVEIQSHSGHVVMSTILNLVLDCGARLAEPGEFTKRAFLNGRIDLSQAEAVADVISARSETALQLATTQLSGRLRFRIDKLIEIIREVQVEIEAHIEFAEDIDSAIDQSTIAHRLRGEVKNVIDGLIEHYEQGHILRDGIRLGIIGRPNVGKSSLLNQLLRRDKAIVTPIPGTTRDLIEDQTCIEGVPMVLTDTAGLRASTDPIEIIGIQRAKKAIDDSDIVLFVIDGSQAFSNEDLDAYGNVASRRHIICVNKIDLVNNAPIIQLPEKFDGSKTIYISAKTGDGLHQLRRALKDQCLNDVGIEPGRSIVPNQRQKEALKKASISLSRSIAGLDKGRSEELIVCDLYEVCTALETIVGVNIEYDVLDDIFSRFCIGK